MREDLKGSLEKVAQAPLAKQDKAAVARIVCRVAEEKENLANGVAAFNSSI